MLVDLLARTDFMEKAGTGIKRVTNACDENVNEVNFEFSDSFWVTMKSNVTDNQQKIILAIKENPEINKLIHFLIYLYHDKKRNHRTN